MTAREVQLMLPYALEWTNQSFWFVCSLHSPLGYAGIRKKNIPQNVSGVGISESMPQGLPYVPT